MEMINTLNTTGSTPSQVPSQSVPQAQVPVSQPKKGGKGAAIAIVVMVVFLVLAIFGSVGVFLFLKGQTYKAALKVSEDLTATSDSLEKVDQSVKDLKAKVGERRSSGITSSSLASAQNVLGTSITSVARGENPDPKFFANLTGQANVYSAILEVATEIQNNFSGLTEKTVFKKSQLVTTPPLGLFSSSDVVTTILQEEHSIALEGFKNSEEASGQVTQLESSLDKASSSIKTSLEGINATVTDSKSFTDEASKVTNYYSTLSDVYLKLIPALTSTYYMLNDITRTSTPSTYRSQIVDLRDTFAKLKTQLSAMSGSGIPKGMDDLHNDNVKLLTLLETYLGNVLLAVDRLDANLLITSSYKFSADIQPITTRSYTYEMNFWQSTKVVKAFDALDPKYKKYADSLQKTMNSNKSPF